MALATTAAVIAGSVAAAGYVDAKLALTRDVKMLLRRRRAEKEVAKNAKFDRLSCFYFFEEAVSKYPSTIAIWSRTASYTWQESHTLVCQYANYFLSLGVRPGQLVAFYLQNSPEFVFAWLGLWAIGCAPAMINFNLSGDALVHCLRLSGAGVLVCEEDEGCMERVGRERRIEGELGMMVVVLGEELKEEIKGMNKARPDDEYRKGLKLKSPVLLLYTSGTTGLPKGCPFPTSRMHFTGALRSCILDQRLGPGGDRWYNCMPMYHGTGGIATMTNMMSGVSTALAKGFSTQNFWADVRDSESTAITYVGETARYLLAAPPHPLDKVHKVRFMHGNGLRPDVWSRFQERFAVPEVAEFFGSTEGMLMLLNWSRNDYTVNAVGFQGALIRYIARNTLVPVEVDTATNDILRNSKTGFAKRKSYEEGGEILVNVPNEAAFPGYWDSAEASEKKFARDVFKKGDLYYRSGDALRRTDDGRWFFLDRLGDTYRWKSENVSTAEVAEVLGTFPGIHEANVYGVLVPGHDGRAGCAALAIAPAQREKFDWASLVKHAKAHLPRYAVPVFIRVVEGEVGGMGSHNNKQSKAPLREEGVNPKERGSKVLGGEQDEVFWIPPKGNSYVKFEERDWNSLVAGGARL